MSETARLRLPFLAAAQAQKHVTHNEALVALDTLVQLSVRDKDLASPPGSPAEGDCYIVAPSATGAWTGWDGRIARYEDGDWRSFLPGAGEGAGWLAFVEDEALLYTFDGEAWIAIAGEALRRAPLAQGWGTFPPAPLKRRVMASPPTSSFGDTPTIASARTLWAGNTDDLHSGTQFTYSRAGDLFFGPAYPDALTTFFRSVDYGIFKGANDFMVSFVHTGQELELMVKPLGSLNMLLRVDGEYLSFTPQNAAGGSGGTNYWHHDFGALDRRRIDLLCSNDRGFQGVRIGPNDSIEPAPLRGPRVAIVGDSFVEAGLGIGMHFADAIGWDDVRCYGISSRGWVAPGVGPYRTIPQTIADIIASGVAFDIVVFLGGLNDQGYGATYAQMKAAAAAGIAALKASMPTCLLVNMGPCSVSGPGRIAGTLYTEVLRGLHEAFVEAGCHSLPLIELPLPDDYEQPAITTLAAAALDATTVRISHNMPGEFTLAPVGRWDRFYVKSVSGSPATWTATVDGTLKAAIASGTALRVVGNSLYTGTGWDGAPSGFGNCDGIVGPDSTHPNTLGRRLHGETMAALMIRLLRRLVAAHAFGA